MRAKEVIEDILTGRYLKQKGLRIVQIEGKAKTKTRKRVGAEYLRRVEKVTLQGLCQVSPLSGRSLWPLVVLLLPK